MTRTLTILTAVVALAVTAAPVASAGTSKAKAPRFERAERATAFVWLAELSPVKAADGHSFLDIGTTETLDMNAAPKRVTDGTSNTVQFVTATPQPGGSNGIIAILIG